MISYCSGITCFIKSTISLCAFSDYIHYASYCNLHIPLDDRLDSLSLSLRDLGLEDAVGVFSVSINKKHYRQINQ